jgi:tetratricopeptide (TPR) repeat protein
MINALMIGSLLLVTTPLASIHVAQDKPPDRLTNYDSRPAPPVSDEAKRNMETRLSEARARYAAEPNNPEAVIWLGRRLGYLGRFTEALETYTAGLKDFPREARLYRHRGHRYITLRRFDLAIADLKKAAALVKGRPDEVEPDGQPNARNIPTSTLQFNIWYHLGLAQYLTGQNKEALDSYRECLQVSKNNDSIVATTHWLYMILRRLKRTKEAARVLEPIHPGMEIIENDGYYRLTLMYKGLLSADELRAETLKQGSSAGSHSVLYGIGNWHLYHGRRDEALKIYQAILKSDQWTSFGYIAAESDLNRFRL